MPAIFIKEMIPNTNPKLRSLVGKKNWVKNQNAQKKKKKKQNRNATNDGYTQQSLSHETQTHQDLNNKTNQAEMKNIVPHRTNKAVGAAAEKWSPRQPFCEAAAFNSRKMRASQLTSNKDP